MRFVLLLAAVFGSVGAGSAVLGDGPTKGLEAKWSATRQLQAEVRINRYLPDGAAGKKQVATQNLSASWSGKMWKHRIEKSPNQYDISAYSGEQKWKLFASSKRPMGYIYEQDHEVQPSVKDGADPFMASYLLYGKPIWEYPSVSEPSPPSADKGNGGESGFQARMGDRKSLSERIRLVKPQEQTPASLKDYDVLVYDGPELVAGIRLETPTRDAFRELAFIDATGAVRGRLTVNKRDPSTGLPLEWEYGEFGRDGKWTSGYRAELASWNLTPKLGPESFAPQFPAGVPVRDKEARVLTESVGPEGRQALDSILTDKKILSIRKDDEAKPQTQPASIPLDSGLVALAESQSKQGVVPTTNGTGWHRVLQILGPVVLVAIVVLFFVLRQKRRAPL